MLAHFTTEIATATAQPRPASVVPDLDTDMACVPQSALVPLEPLNPLCLASFHYQIGNP